MPGDYPTYAELVRARTAKRRARALAALRLADAEAQAAGGRLVVFGSLAEGGFREDSDLDVAILGLSAGPDLEAAAAIDTLLGREGFEADVIPERFLTPSLKTRIFAHGKTIRDLDGRRAGSSGHERQRAKGRKPRQGVARARKRHGARHPR